MKRKIKKICFVGAPSTGKTVLAKSLTGQLRKEGYTAELAREYARDFIVHYGPMKEAADQFLIFQGQKQREKETEERNPDFVVCDCATFLSYVYTFLYEPPKSDKKSWKKYKMVSKILLNEVKPRISDYDYVFFLPVEFKPEEDGTRLYKDKALEISKQIEEFLQNQKVNYCQVRGNPKERLNKVLEVINIKI